MTSLLVLSGSNGIVIPNIILGAFIYCMLKRPQFSKIFSNETHFIYCRCIPKTDAIHSLSLCTECAYFCHT